MLHPLPFFVLEHATWLLSSHFQGRPIAVLCTCVYAWVYYNVEQIDTGTDRRIVEVLLSHYDVLIRLLGQRYPVTTSTFELLACLHPCSIQANTAFPCVGVAFVCVCVMNGRGSMVSCPLKMATASVIEYVPCACLQPCMHVPNDSKR